MPLAEAIAAQLLPQLIMFIEQEIADGQKSAAEATKAALQRLVDEQALAPVLPAIQAMIAEARKTAAVRVTPIATEAAPAESTAPAVVPVDVPPPNPFTP